MELRNKVVVLTGGAEGLGYSIADKFLKHGVYVVIILDINEAKGEEAAKKLNTKHGDNKVIFMKCDVTKDLEAVSEDIMNEFNTVDILVNNAGVVNEYNARKTLELNAIAVVEWSMKFWEHMRTDKGGKGGTIINISSIYGFLVDPFLVYYKASKFAVLGFSKALGHEYNYEMTGVRVLALCPGFTYTTLTSKQMCWDDQLCDFEKFKNSMPWQTPEDVAVAVVEVFQKADSGTAWLIAGGKPVEEAPGGPKITLSDIKKQSTRM